MKQYKNKKSITFTIVLLAVALPLSIIKINALETVAFGLSEEKITSDCEAHSITVPIELQTSIVPQELEISFDDGFSWTSVSLPAGSTNVISTSYTKEGAQDGLYSVQLSLTPVSGESFESQSVAYLHDCSGEQSILFASFNAGGRPGLVNESGDFVFNPSLENTIILETKGAFRTIFLRIAEPSSYLNNTYEVVEFELDYESKLWQAVLPNTLRSGTSSLEIAAIGANGSTVQRQLPQIINPAEQAGREAITTNQKLKVEVYTFDGFTWVPISYKTLYPDAKVDPLGVAHVSLGAGKYYVGLIDGEKRYVSEKFRLEDESIVSISNTNLASFPTALSFASELLVQPNITITSLRSGKTNTAALEPAFNTTSQRLEAIITQAFPSEYSDYTFLMTYWARWDTLSSDKLSEIESLLAQTSRKTAIVLLTDTNNFDELERTVDLLGLSELLLVPVDDSAFLQREALSPGDFFVFDRNGSTVSKFTFTGDTQSLRRNLESLGFIE